jgi:tRNA wybutosine-synthesizing protein 3
MFGSKKEALKKLDACLSEGKVDKGVLKILDLLNRDERFYTTSSCEGRIQVVQEDHIGDKLESRILGKWHRSVREERVRAAISKWDRKGYLFMLVQSPIFHVCCRDLESALTLQQIGFKSGFKYSTIRSIGLKKKGPMKITVELLSSLRLDVPLAHNDKFYPSKPYLSFLVREANCVLRECKDRIRRLEDSLEILHRNDTDNVI